LTFDHAIIGAGLAGLSLADRLAQTLPAHAKVLIIDPAPEAICEKTYASWRRLDEIPHRYTHLVAQSWRRFRITSPDENSVMLSPGSSLEDYVYERISGADFYSDVMKRLSSDPRFEWSGDSVLAVSEQSGLAGIALSSGAEIEAKAVWNSVAQGAPEMIQHFVGFVIETANDFFDPQTVDLMDFRVPQKNQVRFMYNLPFSRRTGLVEFTVFSPKLLPHEEYEIELRNYLAKIHDLHEFKILRVERGAVPMALETLPKFAGKTSSSIIRPIGSAAGLIKASSGYSFERNQRRLDFPAQLSGLSWRFQLYDALLLGIMEDDGGRIASIFPTLFKQNPVDRIFRFLDDRSRFGEELRIFFKLPWAPFLRQLVFKFPFLWAVIFTAILPGQLRLLIPALGLVVAGITHGALDHELDPSARKSKTQFYFFYLLGIAAFLSVWFWLPAFAILVFVLYSADHFGECQFIRSLQLSGNLRWAINCARIWGLFAATFATLIHWNEALPILKVLLRDPVFGAGVPTLLPHAAAILLLLGALAGAWCLDCYERASRDRPSIHFVGTLLLALSLFILPLIPGFLCFFSFWHSWDSIRQQRKVKRWTAVQYGQKSSLFSALAWFGLAAVFAIGNLTGRMTEFLPILFVALGALTLSHARTMKRFYNQLK